MLHCLHVYSSTGEHFETLKKCALVNAFNGEEVYWGSTVQDAYVDLQGNRTSTGNVTIVSSAEGTMREDVPLDILSTITNADNVSHFIELNVSINLPNTTIRFYNISLLWNSTNITVNTIYSNNVTYALINFTMIKNEVRGVPFQILLDDLQGMSSVSFDYSILLYVDGSLEQSLTLPVIVYP